ncbi:MAG: FAD-dependent oxidoreductase, partial [Pseudomonadota bacterium]
MRVAVVGSGIAGLSAAFLLSEQHDVTLFEKADHLGMDAHALDIGTARVDVPLRVFFEGFYPNVIAMYRALGIRFEPINYSASFGLLERGTYFRFDNYRFGRYAVPFLKGRGSFLKTGLRIGLDNIRFFRKTPRDLVQGLSNSLTLAEYLARENYSDAFAEGF